MIAGMFLFFWAQTYQFPMSLENPRAFWADWDGDSVDEIWIKDGNREHWIVDQDGEPRHLQCDQSPQAGFPFFWQNKWVLATLMNDSIYVFQGDNWMPILNFPETRFRPEGQAFEQSPFLVVPTLKGNQLLDDGCPVGELKMDPMLKLGKSNLEVTFPGVMLASVNQDTLPDFQSTPLVNPARGILRMTSFIGQGDFWSPISVELNFPPKKTIQNWAIGHLDEDAFPELVLLVAQPEGGSVFDELEMIIYHGEGPGKWGNLPLQTMKTQQNLWQEGPMEISRRGIRLFYYKGLIRSLFRIDFFPMMEGGVVKPEPETTGWKMKDADRELILTGHDLNGDGVNDLVLADERGLVFYAADSDCKFQENSGHPIGIKAKSQVLEITVGTSGSNQNSFQEHKRVRGNGKPTLIVNRSGVQCWSFDRDISGQWILARQEINWSQ